MNNVSHFINCSGCGLCEGICPKGAIEINEADGFLRPHISPKCMNCGKCLKYCPMQISNKDDSTTHRIFKYKAYGHSSNQKLRNEAASGAITTELLKYLLQNDFVDYVITADNYHYDRNLSYVIIGKKDVDILDRHSGSNYCPVNIGKSLRTIRNIKGRYAIVCLPCLARGIWKLRNNDHTLNSRISYVISPLCNHIPSYNATDFILKKYGVDKPGMIKYRGNGWFGNFRAFSKPDSEKAFFSVPFSEYFASKYSEYFWQDACVNCKDHFGIHSDICMGDADFVKLRIGNDKNDGETIAFTNNDEMFGILKRMNDEKIISLHNDISNTELDQIYGPLSNHHRATKHNTKNNVRSILVEDRVASIITYLKSLIHIHTKNARKVLKEFLQHE